MGVFVGVIWLWCFVGLLWPSLIALVAFGLTGFASFGQIMTMSFGGGVAVLLLFTMILFGSPEHVGATPYITRWFLTRKISNNRPIVFSFVFIFATYVLAIAVNVTPALILMWKVLYGVLKELGYKKGEKFTSLMVVGTFLGAISGQASLPFTGSTLAILSVFQGASGMIVPIPQYMLLGFINSVVVFVIYCLFMKVVLNPADLSKIANVSVDMFNKEPLPPMNKLQKANFYGMLSFVFLVLTPSFLPYNFVLVEALNTLGATGIAIMITGVLCVLKIEGKPILDFRAVAAKSVNWDVYVMVATALAISGALTDDATGFVALMLSTLEPILGGHTPAAFFVIMLLFGIFATSFASAMVLGIAIMPVHVAFGIDAGVNLPAATATLILLMHYSIILPSASLSAAMLWSNREWIAGKQILKYGGFIVIVSTIIAIAVIMPISLILF